MLIGRKSYIVNVHVKVLRPIRLTDPQIPLLIYVLMHDYICSLAKVYATYGRQMLIGDDDDDSQSM